jgi:hypothetical protein
MGKYKHLSEKEKEMLRRMADAQSTAGDTSWVLVVTGGGAELLATDGESIDAVPRAEAFYIGLAEKGFLALGWTSKGNPEFTLQQSAMDYADYAAKSGLGRWWEDLKYDLAEERTVGSKLLWAILGFVLGVIATVMSGILLRVLGWIKIGN